MPPKKPTKPTDALVEQGEQIVKKRGSKSASLEANNSAKAEDVSRILTNCLKWYKMPKVTTLEELDQRIGTFFIECMTSGEIPTVEKLCLAIGYDRQTIWRWETGEAVSNLGAGASDSIKKAKSFLATFESEMVTEGKINPVVYIFRAKNFFGMKDQQDYILTPGNPLGSDADPSTMKNKYGVALPPSDIEE